MNVAILTAIALILVSGVAAVDEDEIAEGRKIVQNRTDCSELSDEQLEAVGEYIMEQRHPGTAHDYMHDRMGLEDGTAAHEQFHIHLAEMWYCDSTPSYRAGYRSLGYGPMYGMMRYRGGRQCLWI